MTLTPQQLDRAVGAVLASAAADALGSQYEFGPALVDEVVPVMGVGQFGHERGEWTDDTAMAMPILGALSRGQSLLDADTLARVVAEWVEWSQTALDVGTQTRSVLGALSGDHSEAHAREAARRAHEVTGRSGGNGSLMRTGPVALGFLREGDEAVLVDAAGRVAQLTHWENDNVDACVLWCLAIRRAVLTGALDVRAGLLWVPAARRERWAAFIDESLVPGRHPRDFQEGNGWVVRAFQSALCAVAGATDLRDAIERAVRGGGDTDTVAAIAGALAGARWGAGQVPAEWRQVLHGWPGIDAAELERRSRAATETTQLW